MVPSYIYPGSAWSQIDAGHPPVDLAIINPASGPGHLGRSEATRRRSSTSHGAGVDVVGYVHTSYGSRSLSTVEKEIAEYESWYHVDGIFVDEASTSCSTRGVVLRAALRVHPCATGARPHDPEPRRSDQPVLHGGRRRRARVRRHADRPRVGRTARRRGRPATRRAASGASCTTRPASLPMSSVLSTLAADGFGEVYVTDQNLPNPYGALPSYWSQELTAAAGTGSVDVARSPQVVTFTTDATGSGHRRRARTRCRPRAELRVSRWC